MGRGSWCEWVRSGMGVEGDWEGTEKGVRGERMLVGGAEVGVSRGAEGMCWDEVLMEGLARVEGV